MWRAAITRHPMAAEGTVLNFQIGGTDFVTMPCARALSGALWPPRFVVSLSQLHENSHSRGRQQLHAAPLQEKAVGYTALKTSASRDMRLADHCPAAYSRVPRQGTPEISGHSNESSAIFIQQRPTAATFYKGCFWGYRNLTGIGNPLNCRLFCMISNPSRGANRNRKFRRVP